MAAKKILIIDDNQTLHELFRDFFENMGYQAETAANGCEGIEKYCTMKPDIVLMDIHMPIMNGYESSMGIRFFDPEAKIVMLTGFPQDPLAEKSLKEGHVLSVLNKPCDLQNLFHKVSSSLSA